MAVDEPLVKQDLLALPLREAREQFERAYLQQQLLLCNGKVGQLAKRVGMERTHLYRKLRALGADFRQLGEDNSVTASRRPESPGHRRRLCAGFAACGSGRPTWRWDRCGCDARCRYPP